MTLFVGLGNPGTAYENNRHNIGFKVIETLVSHFKASPISKASFHGELFKSGETLLLKPSTYMNLSGKSIQAVAHFYKITVEDIIVIHDDLDLPFGALKYKRGGGHGGHNGLKSIDSMMGTEYLRVRMGIDKPPHRSEVASYVLHDFSPLEAEVLGRWIGYTADVCTKLPHTPLEKIKSLYSLKNCDGV